MARVLAWAHQTLMDSESSMMLRMNSVPSVWGLEHSMWAHCMEGQGYRPLLQYSRLPQLVAH